MKQMIRWIKNKRKGFSLAEVLIVVAIMGILAAVSFPAIIQIRDSARQTELDEKAKAIFMTAQNQLLGLKTSGMTWEGADAPGTGLPFTDTPTDFPADVDYIPTNYRYVAVNNNGTTSTFSWMDNTAFSPKNTDGSYIIEYDYKNFMVYGVFYWEEHGGAFQKDSTFKYVSHFNTHSDNKGTPLELRGTENKKNRMKPSVGYYGGQTIGDPEEQKDFNFDLQIENAEELKVILKPKWGESNLRPNATTEKFVVVIRSAFGASDGYVPVEYSFELPMDSSGLWSYNAAENSYTAVLDSIESGSHFKDRFPGIAAGDDIEIYVKGSCDSTSGIYKPVEKSAKVNSLFDGVRGENGTALIKNARHLQNLSNEVSNLGFYYPEAVMTGSEKEGCYPVTQAKLKKDIDWMGTYKDETWDSKCSAGNFYPISNVNTKLVAFDGNYKTIKNLHVTQGTNAGLFGVMQGSDDNDSRIIIENLKLTNPKIEADADSASAGALAGTLKHADIKNCGVFIEYPESDPDKNDLYETYGISKAQIAGGLIGVTQNCTIENSFASVKVAANSVAGGLVGEVKSSTLTKVYSGGHTKNGEFEANTFNVMAAANDGIAGGLIGKIEEGDTDSKTEINFAFSTTSVSAGSNCGTFIGANGANAESLELSDTYAKGIATGKTAQTSIETMGTDTITDTTEWYNPSRNEIIPYDYFYKEDTTRRYPYFLCSGKYYGDWVEEGNATGYVYFEKYLDGGYGFWSSNEKNNQKFEELGIGLRTPEAGITLPNKNAGKNEDRDYRHYTIVKDGYGMLYDRSVTTIKYGSNDLPVTPQTITITNNDNSVSQKYLCELPWDIIDGIDGNFQSEDKYYSEVSIDGKKYYTNMHFAKAIADSASTAAAFNTDQNANAIIRTARQLYELGKNTTYYSSAWNYKQEQNIDFEKYEKYTGQPDYHVIIGNSEYSFNKTFDGAGYEIKNYTMISAGLPEQIALFGYTGSESEIKNVNMVRPLIYASEAAAGLVLNNKGHIINSYVFPEQTEYSSEAERFYHTYDTNNKSDIIANNYTNASIVSKSAAGFVYQNEGTIEKCGVAACVTGGELTIGNEGKVVTAVDDGTEAAGFVYENTGSIQSSYDNTYTAAKNAYGFVYKNFGSGEIDSSYALRRVTTIGGNAYGFSQSSNGINNCYNALSCQNANYFIYNIGGKIDFQKKEGTDYSMLFSFAGEDENDSNYVMTWTENNFNISRTSKKTYKELREIKNVNNYTNASKDNTKRFGKLLASIYPFPKANDVIQYGDWPSYEYVGTEMVYYEIYKDENNQYIVGMYNEDLGIDTIKDDQTIFMDGYALLFNQEYIDMDNVEVKNLIEGNSKDNKKAYINWYDNNGNDGNTNKNYLKSIFLQKDNQGEPLDKDKVFYYSTSQNDNSEDIEIIPFVNGADNNAIILTVNGIEGKYYFRMLPPAAVLTNAYVDNDSVYQPLTITVESTYTDEGFSKGKETISKDRVFYYCPHFAKSKISTTGRPEEEPDHLIVRTVRQLCTLSSANIVEDKPNITNYYDKNFVQEKDIDLGPSGDYAYYYTDVLLLGDSNSRRKNYRHLANSIGSSKYPFVGSYTGKYSEDDSIPNAKIKGLGKWTDIYATILNKKLENINNYSLFGTVKTAKISDLNLADCTLTSANSARSVLCADIDNTTINNITLKNINLTTSQQNAGILVGKAMNSNIGAINTTGDFTITSTNPNCGGLIGYAENISFSGVKCENVIVNGNASSGGIIGTLKGECKSSDGTNIQIASMCITARGINGVGGFAGSGSDTNISNITFDVNELKISADNSNNVGGFIGCLTDSEVSKVALHTGTAIFTADRFAGSFIGSYEQNNTRDEKNDGIFDISISIANNASITARRAYGGMFGRISVVQPTNFSNISLQGSCEIMMNNSTASDNREYHGTAVFAGIIDLKNTINISDIKSEGIKSEDKINILLPDITPKYQNNGLLIGTVFDAANCIMNLGNVAIRNANINIRVSDGTETPYTGGLIGYIQKNININALQGTVWDFSGSTEYIDGSNNILSYTSGVIGYNKDGVNVQLPDEIWLPDIIEQNTTSVKAESMVAGVVINPMNKNLTIKAQDGGSKIHVGKILAPSYTAVGGFTDVLKSNTKLSGGTLLVEGINDTSITGINAGGFVGKLEKDISRVYVDNISVEGTENAGGFAGVVNNVNRIDHCYATGVVAGVKDATGVDIGVRNAGGFAGKYMSAGNISDCYAIVKTQSATDTIGGFIGCLNGNAEISNSFAAGDVSGFSDDTYAGGFCGRIEDSVIVTMRKCYSLGKVSPTTARQGGFLGCPKNTQTDPNKIVLEEFIPYILNILNTETVKNRNVSSEFGRRLWDVVKTTQIDSSVRGCVNSGNSGALMYAVLGYPEYGEKLKDLTDCSELNTVKLLGAYQTTFNSDHSFKDKSSENSYYQKVYKPATENGVMALWRIAKHEDGKYYFTWINALPTNSSKIYGYSVEIIERQNADGSKKLEMNGNYQNVEVTLKENSNYYDNKDDWTLKNDTIRYKSIGSVSKISNINSFVTFVNCSYLYDENSLYNYVRNVDDFNTQNSGIEKWTKDAFAAEIQKERSGENPQFDMSPDNSGQYPYPCIKELPPDPIKVNWGSIGSWAGN